MYSHTYCARKRKMCFIMSEILSSVSLMGLETISKFYYFKSVYGKHLRMLRVKTNGGSKSERASNQKSNGMEPNIKLWPNSPFHVSKSAYQIYHIAGQSFGHFLFQKWLAIGELFSGENPKKLAKLALGKSISPGLSKTLYLISQIYWLCKYIVERRLF